MDDKYQLSTYTMMAVSGADDETMIFPLSKLFKQCHSAPSDSKPPAAKSRKQILYMKFFSKIGLKVESKRIFRLDEPFRRYEFLSSRKPRFRVNIGTPVQ